MIALVLDPEILNRHVLRAGKIDHYVFDDVRQAAAVRRFFAEPVLLSAGQRHESFAGKDDALRSRLVCEHMIVTTCFLDEKGIVKKKPYAGAEHDRAVDPPFIAVFRRIEPGQDQSRAGAPGLIDRCLYGLGVALPAEPVFIHGDARSARQVVQVVLHAFCVSLPKMPSGRSRGRTSP